MTTAGDAARGLERGLRWRNSSFADRYSRRRSSYSLASFAFNPSAWTESSASRSMVIVARSRMCWQFRGLRRRAGMRTDEISDMDTHPCSETNGSHRTSDTDPKRVEDERFNQPRPPEQRTFSQSRADCGVFWSPSAVRFVSKVPGAREPLARAFDRSRFSVRQAASPDESRSTILSSKLKTWPHRVSS